MAIEQIIYDKNLITCRALKIVGVVARWICRSLSINNERDAQHACRNNFDNHVEGVDMLNVSRKNLEGAWSLRQDCYLRYCYHHRKQSMARLVPRSM